MTASPPRISVAHIRAGAQPGAAPVCQNVVNHLCAVADMAASFADKARLPLAGRLVGLLHDLGKYSTKFQHYILSAHGLIAPEDPDYVSPHSSKGKIDHSTAGAQAIWSRFAKKRNAAPWAQMLALCMASHHTGMQDCTTPAGEDTFQRRMDKAHADTHFPEVLELCDLSIAKMLQGALPLEAIGQLYSRAGEARQRVAALLPEGAPDADVIDNENSRDFQQGLLTRFLLSCLLVADRIDSAEFDDPGWKKQRARMPRRPWDRLVPCLEAYLEGLGRKYDIDALRRHISDQCARRAKDAPGLFTLTVPTGGGKTLASLRFALRHAQAYGLDRVIYVIPYTSIIDQNAQVAREIFEADEEPGSIVLEHHSNIVPTEDLSEDEGEAKNWERLAENWEAPVVFTTMVQFLESLFGTGTRHTRRMHNLARSVLVFDEIQTLPVRCLHMFCNALDFLIGSCGASAVLCTATQPRLGNVPRPQLGSLRLDPRREIMDDVPGLFASLRRTDFFDHCAAPMEPEAVAALALEEARISGSCLVVCNTKGWAEKVYALCAEQWKGARHYLSTNLCPAHRMEKLATMRTELDKGAPVLCVSTQLIECGVDISFGSVIRLAAGLDSILQAAGRCNRHGGPVRGRVHVVKARQGSEPLDMLPDIQAGRDIFLNILHGGCATLLQESGYDLTHPSIVETYFDHYFYRRGNVMRYKVRTAAREDTLLSMLGSNTLSVRARKARMLHQSFGTAAGVFQAIETPTRAILVPYGKGAQIIADLYSTDIFHRRKDLLRQAQRYSVNVYPNVFKKLVEKNSLHAVQQSGILSLDETFYSQDVGIVTQPVGFLRTLFFGQED